MRTEHPKNDEDSFPKVVSSTIMKRFITHMNDNDGSPLDPRLGNEIEFMERNNIDSYRLLPLVGDFARDANSPVLADLLAYRNELSGSNTDEDQFVRLLHLQLKAYFRNKFGLGPLSQDEMNCWPVKHPFPSGFPRMSIRQPGKAATDPVHVLSKEDGKRVAKYVADHFPDLVTYYCLIIRLSEQQGYVTPNDVGRTGVIESMIHASAKVVLEVDHVGSIDIVKDFFCDAK